MRISDWSSDVCSSDLEPRTVTIMTLPSLETEQPSARRPKAAPRPANQLTPPSTTPATRARQGPQASPDRPASDQAALTLPVAPSPLPARMNVDMPHPQPASPQAASSTLDRKSTRLNSSH